jgi:thiosulfate/3-mercaptopyruvate sulfurtransferase
VPAQKKVWVYDGSIAQYPEDFTSDTHASQGCTSCHGGDDTASTREAAHTGAWQPIPGADTCDDCHADGGASGAPQVPAAQMANSLHVNLGGYVKILGDRGFDATASVRFDEQCTRCHIANDETPIQPACGHCHVAVPRVANGGFLNGHNFRKTPDMERNCTACHGSRVKDEFFGLNNDLIERNGLNVTPIQPDIHFAKTQELNDDGFPMGCTLCHGAGEMHGAGAPDPVNSGDRYDVTEAPECEDCHGPGSDESGGSTADFNAVALHTVSGGGTHLTNLACQACHAQPYKNCFGCHTDVDQNAESDTFGLPFYNINEGDPTTFANGGPRPEGAAPDALMTFRIGKNPRFGEPGQKKFAVLRHVPADKDVFTYTGAAATPGLFPTMTASPTWKYATPHNIQSRLEGTSAAFNGFDVENCNNCHAADYEAFWLIDPVQNSEGWLETQYEADETTANSGVIQATPLEFNQSN